MVFASRGIQVALDGRAPRVAEDAFVAPDAVLVGDVTVESGASIWFGAVLRADDAPIRVCAGANVQDNAVLHVGPGGGTLLEEDVSVGHSAVVHNCTVRRGAVIGMRSCVQDRAVVGAGALVAAGAVVPEGFVVPDGHTAGGVPARVFGPNSERSRHFVEVSAGAYRALVDRYRRTAVVLDTGVRS
jgi:carbonic anhydrase/acetyltransferase-like protein (isoleucine patch superfamily)